MLICFGKPVVYLLESSALAYIEDENNAKCISVVRLRHYPKAFLSSSIPQLQPHSKVIDLASVIAELDHSVVVAVWEKRYGLAKVCSMRRSEMLDLPELASPKRMTLKR